MEQELTYPIQPRHEREAEDVARLRTEGIQFADKRCRRLFRGEVAYTPVLQKLISLVRVWKYVRRKKEGKKVSSSLLARLLKCAKISTLCYRLMQLSIEEISDKLRQSYKNYREYKNQSAANWKQWLHQLAESRAMNEGLDKTSGSSHDEDDTFSQATLKNLKALIHIEATWTLFRRIHSAVGKDRM